MYKVWLGGAKWTLNAEQFAQIHSKENPEAASEAAAILYLQDEGVIPDDFSPAINLGPGASAKVIDAMKKQMDSLKKEIAELKKDQTKKDK
jgi:hypothetical protein